MEQDWPNWQNSKGSTTESGDDAQDAQKRRDLIEFEVRRMHLAFNRPAPTNMAQYLDIAVDDLQEIPTRLISLSFKKARQECETVTPPPMSRVLRAFRGLRSHDLSDPSSGFLEVLNGPTERPALSGEDLERIGNQYPQFKGLLSSVNPHSTELPESWWLRKFTQLLGQMLHTQ